MKTDTKVFAWGLKVGIFIKTLKPCIGAEKRLFMRETGRLWLRFPLTKRQTRVISFRFAFVYR